MQAAQLLLEYCLSDIDIGKSESLQQLVGIQLIPSMSGSLTSLQLSSAHRARPLFLATRQQQEVLTSARDALVSFEVSSLLCKPSPALMTAFCRLQGNVSCHYNALPRSGTRHA